MNISAIETMALAPGSTVKQYAVIDSVGFDTQGSLYRAECTRTQRTVLLYEYWPQGLATRRAGGIHAAPGRADAAARALSAQATRLRAAALIGHPALPTLDDIWEQDGALYAAGPWRPGRSLMTELTARAAPIDADMLRTWARTLCDALSALHRQDLIHGNLSPALIRVLDGGGLLLPPLGGTVFESDAPPWVAPEQHPLCPKPHATGPWTDIYQLSALLHHAITGLPPPAVTRRWEGAALERLAAVSGHFPAELLLATSKGLSMHPAARPQSTEQWLDEAGLPDRREHMRYEEDEVGAADVAGAPRAVVDAAAAAATVPGRGMAAAVADEPLSDDTGPSFSDLEDHPAPHTPVWVWVAAILAVGGLVAILLSA